MFTVASDPHAMQEPTDKVFFENYQALGHFSTPTQFSNLREDPEILLGGPTLF